MTFVVQLGKLKGPFRGFRNQQTRFTFTNRTVWRQAEAKYHYFYVGNPFARVICENGVYHLEVEGCQETVQVVEEN